MRSYHNATGSQAPFVCYRRRLERGADLQLADIRLHGHN